MGYTIQTSPEKSHRVKVSCTGKSAPGKFFGLTENSCPENRCNSLKTRHEKSATHTKTAQGVLFEHYRYTAFGEVEVYSPTGTKLNGSAIGNTVMWNSRRYDEATGLHYYLYRHYKADIGRWLGRDPYKEFGGYNLYGFVYNTPLFYVDTFGLWILDAIQDTISVVGLIPVVGNIADVANAGISVARGNLGDAALHAAAAIPIAGQGVTAGRLGARALDRVNDFKNTLSKSKAVSKAVSRADSIPISYDRRRRRRNQYTVRWQLQLDKQTLDSGPVAKKSMVTVAEFSASILSSKGCQLLPRKCRERCLAAQTKLASRIPRQALYGVIKENFNFDRTHFCCKNKWYRWDAENMKGHNLRF